MRVEYQESDATALVGEIFSGEISVVDAIERLRTRLLDLSARNRLLNYRHPKGHAIQIAGEPNIGLVLERLIVDGKGVPLKSVPEPPPDTYEGKRPEVKQHALELGIATAFEFPPSPARSSGRKLNGIQTLLYPADLERQCRKIASEAKTAIEETGSNMLFLVFGFLEFYDSDESTRALQAPLLSLPVNLARAEIDRETGTYRYAVQHNGEELTENHTLREKLRRDFLLALPDFEEDEKPEAYFVRIEKTIKNHKRWKVRRQITLGMLSFGKLAIWSDLDPKKNPGLLRHKLIKSVFSGGSGSDGALFAEDYRIDDLPEDSPGLIYDADSSQHSAIVDVLAGKNLVINGPPGTGKSQTITNIIAAALSQGKKVLFVSEKLAALEVVRHRLNQAGLGHFCLELHSHKTQKAKFLEDIRARIEQRFRAPTQFKAKVATLQEHKTNLARHAELMGSRVGNALGLTVNEVFWAVERRRQELGDLTAEAKAIGLRDAPKWALADIESRRSSIAALAELYDAIGNFDTRHPWWGFRPKPLFPSDDEAIARIIQQALDHAILADAAAEEAVKFFRLDEQPATTEASKTCSLLATAPAFPAGADPTLLPTMFDAQADPNGERSARALADVTKLVSHARTRLTAAATVLLDEASLSKQEADEVRSLAQTHRLDPVLLAADIRESLQTIARAETTIEAFATSARLAGYPYRPADKVVEEAFLASVSKPFLAELSKFSPHSVASRAAAVSDAVGAIEQAIQRVRPIALRSGLPFDTSPESAARLACPNGLPGLSKDVPITAASLTEARRLAAFALTDTPTSELQRLHGLLEREVAACFEALAGCQQTVAQLGLEIDSTEVGIAQLHALAEIAAAAPADLLDYRMPTYGQEATGDLLAKLRASLAGYSFEKLAFEPRLYLDSVPPLAELDSAVRVLRSKDGFFSFLNRDYRKATRLHAGLCKEKRKMTGKQRSDELARLKAWIEAKDAFVASSELRACFGSLFRGLDTDARKIASLYDWYRSSRRILNACPGLATKVNLSTIPAERLLQLATRADQVKSDTKRLVDCEAAIKSILGADIAGFREAKAQTWKTGLDTLRKAIESIGAVTGFFKEYAELSLSPRMALSLMEIRVGLDGVAAELSLLMEGRQALREAGGEELGRLTDLAIGPWCDVLPAISSQVTMTAQLAQQAAGFVGDDALISDAHAFVKARQEFEEAWACVAAAPASNRFSDWTGLTEAAYESTTAARLVLERVAPLCRAGASAEDFFAASAEQAHAQIILNGLADSHDVQASLGDAYKGINTDLESLSTTHKWGAAIWRLGIPTAMCRRLLSADAPSALDRAQRIYADITDGCRQARETVESLASYGSLSWSEWQQPVRSTHSRETPSAIKTRLQAVANSPESVLPWSKYLSLREQATTEGIGQFAAALESGRIPSSALIAAFEFATYQSIGHAIYKKFPELTRFDGSHHEKRRIDYQVLDAEIVSLTGMDFASQIAKNTDVPEGQCGATVGDYTEMHLLRREINKQRRHIPIRQLLKRAGKALQELKPCFMMGPLSVAQYLEQGALAFDLIVMDEASQLRPEEALGAIARGSQLVVVGDPKQLPPTSFFDRMLDAGDGEDEEAPAAVSGMESILDICQQLFSPVRSLRWHYRSQHESLIAFSNHHFYKNLIVFPSPYAKNGRLGLKYRYVKGGAYKDRQNVPEAQRVCDAVLEHMLKRPDESLGVVTLNQTQRELIEELLEKKLKTFHEGAAFMERWEAAGWPFFVKNLENVQGDERDVIFISTTFGKVPGTNKPRQNFGPISRADGWRRLNVLFTRSKRRVELFTSMTAEDIVVDDRTPLGTKALRDYLDFARRGVLVATDECEREPDSDFEVSVANVIRSLGYDVKSQLGVAGFFLDMAVRNPDRPGEFLAAIECDGATYHSGFSVRDRDRIRQEILESLGWKERIYRIWSTDWFYDPRKEIDRLRRFLAERRRLSALEGPEVPEEINEVDEEDYEDIEPDTNETQIAEDQVATTLAEELSSASDGADDIFVEVGDRVTYCLMNNPQERNSVLIVDSASNPKMGLVNEATPLAQALLGLSAGDVGLLGIHGQNTHQVKVLKIQRLCGQLD